MDIDQMKEKADDEQPCDYCGDRHHTTPFRYRSATAVVGEFCPAGLLPEGDDACDRCGVVLTGGKGALITHPDPPKGVFLSVCEPCLKESAGGGSD